MSSPPFVAMAPLQVIGLAGSLRQGSYNRALLRAARELAPPGLRILSHEIAPLPFYNGDLEAEGAPASVRELRAAVRAADALLVVTPEYNHGIPGVLKNTIDWLSRPPTDSALRGKPAAMMGASPGSTGTARCQTQLREAFAFTNTFVMPQPECLVGRAHEKFDAAGNLLDADTRTYLVTFLGLFADWVHRCAACSAGSRPADGA